MIKLSKGQWITIAATVVTPIVVAILTPASTDNSIKVSGDNTGQINGIQNNYFESPKRLRSIDGIKTDLLAIADKTINKIIINSSVADKESGDFATDIKELFDNNSYYTEFSYCLRQEKLPDGIFYSKESTSTLIIFIGADDGTYALNEVRSGLNICSMSLKGFSAGSQGKGNDLNNNFEASQPIINQHPDPIPYSKSYSASSAIVGPCLDGSKSDHCMRAGAFVSN